MRTLPDGVSLLGPLRGPLHWRGSLRGQAVVVHFCPAERQGRARFRVAERLTCRLRHPSIVRCVHQGHRAISDEPGTALPGTRWFCTPIASEGSGLLAAPDGIGEWVRWVCALLDALAHVHSRGWLHLDVTPDNTLIHRNDTGQRDALLADWGNAVALRNIAALANGRSRSTGTPGFAAPEVERGQVARWGPWSDVFGVARTARFWLEQAGLDAPDEWEHWLRRSEAPIADRFASAAVARHAARGLAPDPAPAPGAGVPSGDEVRDPVWVGHHDLAMQILARMQSGTRWVEVAANSPGLGASALARALVAHLGAAGEHFVLPPLQVPDAPAALRRALRQALGFGAADGGAPLLEERVAAWFPRLDARALARVARWLAAAQLGAPQLRGEASASAALLAIAEAVPAPWRIVVDASTVDEEAEAVLRAVAASADVSVIWIGPRASSGDGLVIPRLSDAQVADALADWGVAASERSALVRTVEGRAGAIEGAILRAGVGGAGDLGMGPLREQYDRNVAHQLALACAAALGPTFESRVWRSTLDVVGAISGRHLEPVLLELGVWDEPLPGELAFRHEQVHAVVVEWAAADGVLSRAHAACLSVRMPTADAGIEACVRVARHAVGASQPDVARMLWTRACRDALRAGRLEEALLWAEDALRAEESEERAMALALVRWKAIRRLWRDAPDAPVALERLHDRATEAGMLDLAASADVEHAYWRMALGDTSRGLALAQRGRVLLEAWGDAAQLGVALAAEALLLRRGGEVEAALACYAEAARCFGEVDDAHSLSHCELGRGNTLLQAGRVSEAVQAYTVARDGLAGDPAELANVFNGMGECARLQGELTLATDLYERALHLWDLCGSNMRGIAEANLGIVLAQRGSFEASRVRLREAYVRFRDGGRAQAAAHVLLWSAVAANDRDEARAFLEQVGVHREGLDAEAESALVARWGEAPSHEP